MNTTYLIISVVMLLISLVCAAAAVLLLLLFVVGLVMLRRRGKKNISAREAVQAGAERVSQVFMRTEGGLRPVDDEDEDDRPIG
ncbi:MAG: hypothetical protein R3F59_39215 [Myxococcota bacterium]